MGDAMKVDAIRIIEAGYSPASSDEQWLSPIVEAFGPLARDMGAYLGEHHPEALRAILSPNPSVVCWSSERGSCIPPGALEPIRALFREWPLFKDCLGVLSAEPVGPSLLVSVPYRKDVTIPPRTRWQLATLPGWHGHSCCSPASVRSAGPSD